MDYQSPIVLKLEEFIKKYYTNEIIRGTIFFVGLGLIYLLLTSFIEYFLWLPSFGRTVLFVLFIVVQFFLLIRFLLIPFFKLLKLQKGLDYSDASFIIGNHFPDVSDKLTNFLQLSQSKSSSELLLASITQREKDLKPIPFSNAINFNSNTKWLPILLFPILIVSFVFLSGKKEWITQSMNRVVHFKQEYTPPAPFYFVLDSPLSITQNSDYTLILHTEGSVFPENATITIGNENYYLKNIKPGVFEYVFSKPTGNISFNISANNVVSKNFTLKVIAIPVITNFEINLNFPAYLKRKREIIKGTGNAIIPEGTTVNWFINTIATENIQYIDKFSKNVFSKKNTHFYFTKNINQNTDYQIITSNFKLQNFEKIQYSFQIVKDAYPTIKIDFPSDSLQDGNHFCIGQVSDDYGFSKLQIVYYPKNKPTDLHRANLPLQTGNYDRFVFQFPSSLAITPGITYDYYFEIFDNDAPHHFKSAKSTFFSHRVNTNSENDADYLEQQNDNINNLQKTLNSQNKQFQELDKLQKNNKEKENFDYKEQQKINNFLQKQQNQDEMMKSFSNKIEQNLEKFKSNKEDADKKLLQERLTKTQQEIEKNQKLLEELKELNKKLDSEELFEKIEKFQQKSKNQSKSLEQLVELTKRYYVEKKAEQLAEQLQNLAKKQDELSNEIIQNSPEKQANLNKEFNDILKDLHNLKKENADLKKPLSLPDDVKKEQNITEDIDKALKDLQNKQNAKASAKQKSASKKMMEMSQKMQMDMESASQDQLEEDIKMLRQILDNLLHFSFTQEELITKFKTTNKTSSSFTKNLIKQQDLKNQFKHIDDSLFAMSLRNPKISEQVSDEISKVYYNLSKSTDLFSDNQLSRGVAAQQYVLTSTNNLADFLSEILSSMQLSMSGSGEGKPKPGKGKGSEMQLPDIIKKQEGLSKKMKNAKSNGNSSSPNAGEKPKPGDSKEKQGSTGKGSKEGSTGNDGEGSAQDVLDVLKEQQQLRDALEQELSKSGFWKAGQSVLDQMKQMEKQLINKGFSNDVLQKSLNLEYELLKLENAMQTQNQDSKRKSTTNTSSFNNTSNPLPKKLQEYLQSIEILNRQTLPLQPNFNKKVQEYFKNNDKF